MDRAPPGLWRIYLRVEGDSFSPYVPESESLHLLLHLQDGALHQAREGRGAARAA